MSAIVRGTGRLSRVVLHPSINVSRSNARVLAFSTHRSLLKDKDTNNINPQLPSFRISDIVSTRRGRAYLIGTLVVLATVEGIGWWNFSPKIFGWESVKDESDE
jgi:hypothetical protein